MSVKFTQDGYHTCTSTLTVYGAKKLLTFLKEVFGATERMLMNGPNDSIAHAEVGIGDSVIMIGDASPDFPPRGGAIYVYVEDVDVTYKRALEAGAKPLREPADQFYGDRSAGVEDSFGIYWGIATHIEDVSPEEIEKRMKAFAPPQPGGN
jgi:PhnB protein